MKFIITSLFILTITIVTSISLSAQFKTDGQFLQGTANINQSFGNNADRAKQFSASVDLGKYKSKNSANIFSLLVAFRHSAPYPTSNNNDTKAFNVGLGKGQEFYKTLIGKFTMYGRVMGNLNYYKTETGTDNTKGINLNLSGNGGLIYPINPHWLITAQLLQVNIANIGYEWGHYISYSPSGPGNRIDQSYGSSATTEVDYQKIIYDFSPDISFSYGLGIRYVIK